MQSRDAVAKCHVLQTLLAAGKDWALMLEVHEMSVGLQYSSHSSLTQAE